MKDLTNKIDRAGETSLSARCNLIQACRCAVDGETGLLATFVADRLDMRPSRPELLRAAIEYLAQY
jgi:hypothetical protein